MNHWYALRMAVRNQIRSVVLSALPAAMQQRRCEVTRLGRPTPDSGLMGLACFYGVTRGAVRAVVPPVSETRIVTAQVRVVLTLRTGDCTIDRYADKTTNAPEDVLEQAAQNVIACIDRSNVVMAAANTLCGLAAFKEPLRFLNDTGEFQDARGDWFYADEADWDKYDGLILALDFGEAKTAETPGS